VTELTPDANYLAVQIQRRHPPDMWAAHIAEVPDDKREAVAAYLRDIYRRIKTHRKQNENG
jgi:uncharacterized protein YllA (UPF0747 family)